MLGDDIYSLGIVDDASESSQRFDVQFRIFVNDTREGITVRIRVEGYWERIGGT